MQNTRTLTRKEQVFLPWFLTIGLKKNVSELLPPYYHVRLRLHYRKFGCIACSTKTCKDGYGGNGLCQRCYARVGDRLRRIDMSMQKKFGHELNRTTATFLKRLKSARELLADLKGIL